MIGRCLSGFYNNRNGIKREFIWDVVNKVIILKLAKIKKSNDVAKGIKEVKGI